MSIRVKQRLTALNINDTTHEERVALDQEIERMTGMYCDKGVDSLSDTQVRDALQRVRERLRKKQREMEQMTDEQIEETVSAYA